MDNTKIAKVIRGLVSAMEMQEKRELGEFHIPADSALRIWNDAKEEANKVLALLDAPKIFDGDKFPHLSMEAQPKD